MGRDMQEEQEEEQGQAQTQERQEQGVACSQKAGVPAQGDKTANYLTMLGHCCSDINQGAISAVLPFLVVSGGYSYTQVAMLVFAANIASAIIQPLFGIVGDKRQMPWLMALGVFLAGLGMTGIGFLDSYWAIVASAMVSGIGIAMFHPEGGRLANLAAGERKGNGMSIFAVGGTIGFFIGPILTAGSLQLFGMHGTLVFIFPATVCSIILLANNRRFLALGDGSKAASAASDQPEYWGKFWLVMVTISARSVLFYGLMAFIPLMVMGTMGQSEATSSMLISGFAIAGAIATALSGRIAERFDILKLMAVCFGIAAALIAAFALNNSFALAVPLVLLMALALDVSYPASCALGMSYVPRHLGTASGINYGLALCVGGIAEPFLGMAGDHMGLTAVMFILVVVAVAAVVVTLVLHRIEQRE